MKYQMLLLPSAFFDYWAGGMTEFNGALKLRLIHALLFLKRPKCVCFNDSEGTKPEEIERYQKYMEKQSALEK